MLKQLIAALALAANVATAQTAIYGAGGQIVGLKDLAYGGAMYEGRFYYESMYDMYINNRYELPTLMLVVNNDPVYGVLQRGLQEKLAEIVRTHGTEWIPGCAETCMIMAAYGNRPWFGGKTLWDSWGVRKTYFDTRVMQAGETTHTKSNYIVWRRQ